MMSPHPTGTPRMPDLWTLEQAPERAALHVAGTAARCARVAVILEHRDLFEEPTDAFAPPSPLDLAARQLVAHFDELLAALDLYEIALREDLRQQHDDMLF